jgi:iron complex outermembrane receptor protein
MYAVENQFGRIPGYGLINARVAYQFGGSGLEVALFGRNLADRKYLVRRFSDLYRQVGFAAEYPGESRAYGISLNWQFGK